MPIRITIRFTDEEKPIHQAIAKIAHNNRRSLNAELLRAIEYYLKNAPEAHDQVESANKAQKPKEAKT
jgi:hypothetical protein